MKTIVQNQTLLCAFSGDFDNRQISEIKPTVIALIEKSHSPIVKFDFAEVQFVDSTGIGFVLARYNQIQAYGGELVLCNLSSSIRRVFALSGIFSIIRVENEPMKRGMFQ